MSQLITPTENPKGSRKPYQLAVIFGRFEPFHVGHQMLLNKAYAIADEVLVLIGSAFKPRDIKNSFTYRERSFMITEAAKPHKVHIHPLVDDLYSNDEWLKEAQKAISSTLTAITGWEDRPGKPSVAIVGHKKDFTSDYLDWFPQYDLVEMDEIPLGLDATAIRKVLFEKPEMLSVLKSLVHEATHVFLQNFLKTEEYQRLVREYNKITKYKKDWSGTPHPSQFMTVDAVVKKTGHILLGKRKFAPGEDLWALPGGFLESMEFLVQAVLRELGEETNIDLPPGLLRNSMSEPIVFDHPFRSLRGRTVSFAFLFDLDKADTKTKDLPFVKAGSDFKEVKFFTFAEVLAMSEEIFEDHLSIIRRVAAI